MWQLRTHASGLCGRRLAAASALLLTAAGAALAQGPPAGAGPPGFRNPKGDTDVQTDREARLRSGEVIAAANQMSRQRLAAVIEQTRQDFKRIQLIRNDVVDALVAKKPLDFKLIARQAGEVNERALRLKSFLMPPAPGGAKGDGGKKDEKKPAVEYDSEALKGALVKLCNTIYNFTGNQMFQSPDTVNAEKAAKAGGDLLDIIELSDQIKRSADRLSKSSK